MSTSLSVILKRLAMIFVAAGVLFGITDALFLRCDQDRLALLYGDSAILSTDGKPASSSRKLDPRRGSDCHPRHGCARKPGHS